MLTNSSINKWCSAVVSQQCTPIYWAKYRYGHIFLYETSVFTFKMDCH